MGMLGLLLRLDACVLRVRLAVGQITVSVLAAHRGVPKPMGRSQLCIAVLVLS